MADYDAQSVTQATASERSPRGDVTRDRLKQVARDLFLREGFENVTVRDIARAAGQKNSSAVNYYFGGKDGLLVEILEEGLQQVEQCRHKMLDELEAEESPVSLRDAIRAIHLIGLPLEDDGLESFMVFYSTMFMERREVVSSLSTVSKSQSFWRCFRHIRRHLPELPGYILLHRSQLLAIYVSGVLGTQHQGRDSAGQWRDFWATQGMMTIFLDTAVGLMAAPISEPTPGATPLSSHWTGGNQ
jgi:AcrR family transcriptional regulator